MSHRAFWSVKAFGLLLAWTLVLGGVIALLLAGAPPARAAPCDQAGPVISGTWTINTVEVCTGILYTVDGSVTIASGGSLTLTNGGLIFAKDAFHTSYALTVQSGGALILDNSIVSVQTTAIAPYLKLPFTVTGPNAVFTMRNGAILKFPGTFTASSATITLSDSAITGFYPGEIVNTGLYVDDNDDSPVISWSATTATLMRSAIARIYENSSAVSAGANATGVIEGNVSLSTGSNLYAYDSYIGVDFSNVFGLHNELQVDGTSNAYLYNVTIDRTQDPVSETEWQPAYRPLSASGGNVYLLRWAHVTVVDATDFPVAGAAIWSTLSPSPSTASYPDSGTTIPSTATLNYLGKTSSGATAWNVTDSNGQAIIPLYTDDITYASLPNAVSFGNYAMTVSVTVNSVTYTGQGGVSFPPYPAIKWTDNNVYGIAKFTTLRVRTGPDLALHQTDYTTILPEIENQPFALRTTIYNEGQTGATGVTIAAYLDHNLSAPVAQVTGLSVAALSSIHQNLSIPGISGIAQHTIELIVDPLNAIPEGGVAQESNNFANVTINVQPPPAGFVALAGPDNGVSIEPGTTMTITGYVRQTDTTPIPGVVVTIQLKYGTTTVVQNTTQSDNTGFFIATIAIPSDAQQGTYTLVAQPSVSVISADSRTISVARAVPFINQPVPVLGLPWWLFLVIVAAIVVALVAVTMYFKVYGLGKMVECGECGAFIPEDATRCPKCGVEFEKDMAKCSNCQAWIPTDVKVCPECGVEFATGQLDMTDYQEKMRLQYDEVVQRFRQDAQSTLGRSLSNKEFNEWWRTQPTFLTFEDWLREEEEMRKMGSRPCPTCGTLNSVTAKVCHKCGTMMKEPTPRAPTGATKVMAPKTRVARQAPPAEEAEGAAPPARQAPPTASPVVVQKKVVKRPPVEGEQTEGQDAEKTQGDEL